MKKREFQRTCKRDGTVWYVSKAAAKERKPNAFLRAGTRMQGAGSQASFGSWSKAGGATQLSQMESKIDRIERNNSCPQCGSSSFRQKLVRGA